MDSSLITELVTTKDAGKISGYSPDYLARLVRSKKIVGNKIGHTWLINRKSLLAFLEEQKKNKSVKYQKLSTVRLEEYKEYHATRNASPAIPPPPHVRAYPTPVTIPLRSHLYALSVACAVIVFGVVGAYFIPGIYRHGDDLVAIAQEASSGFHTLYGTIPDQVMRRMMIAHDALRGDGAHAALAVARAAYVASPMLAEQGITALTSALAREYTSDTPSTPINRMQATNATEAATQLISQLHAFFTDPAYAARGMYDWYRNIGLSFYHGSTGAFEMCRVAIRIIGDGMYEGALAVRDILARTPARIVAIAYRVGDFTIEASRTVIRADIGLAYFFAAVAPETARAMTLAIGTLGDRLVYETAQAPRYAQKVAAVPAHLAPMLAAAAFGAEYDAAKGFIAMIDVVTTRYLAGVETVGQYIEGGAEDVLAVGDFAGRLAAAAVGAETFFSVQVPPATAQ